MSYSTEVLADAPLGYYRMSEASGFLQDASGSARHADEIHGAPTFQQTSPIVSDASDKAILCHATGPDWWHVPYYAAFDIADVFTVEVWLKRVGTSAGEQIILCRDQGFYLGLNAHKLALAKTNVAFIAQSTATITDTTTWHHVVNTKNGATVKQYIDSVDVTGTVTNATCANGTTPGITIAADGGGTPFDGSLDELAIYGTALSQARVTAHYNAAFGQIVLPDADLATAGWATAPLFSKLNDGSDATIVTATAA